MFEPHHDVDHDVEASMAQFLKARIGKPPPLVPKQPKSLLLVLDGSSQDATAVELAAELKQRFSAELHVCDGREHFEGSGLADAVSKQLDAKVLPKGSGAAFDQVLAAIVTTGCELVILPCPFGRDLVSVGSDSTGTVIDVLLERSSVPLLVVRQPGMKDLSSFLHLDFPLIGENEAAPEAAAWALGVCAPHADLELQLVLEHEVAENVRELMRNISPETDITEEQLTSALQQSCVRLHRSLETAAAELGFRYRLRTSVERESPDEVQETGLLVLALERSDHLSEGYVHDKIRHSQRPVLVIPHGGTAALPRASREEAPDAP